MPKGVPKAGFRMTRKRMEEMGIQSHFHRQATVVHFSREEPKNQPADVDVISHRIAERFGIMTTIVESAIAGHSKAVIISGPPGVGKSFEVERVLSKSKSDFTITKGFVRATGLFKLLWKHREANQVLVFDDADSIFSDDIALNLLKAVCDTTERRVVSWLTESKFEDEEGEVIPKKFEFEGTIVFITNLDFDGLIQRQHKLSAHLEALMSRAHYVDLTINTPTACLIRVKQVIEAGMFKKFKFTDDENNEIIRFMSDNVNELREVSLRMAVKIATLYHTDRTNWKRIVRVTCCKK